MDIGKRINELRVAKGLTQEELADRAELSKGFISQLEHDQASPSISTLEDILICLGSSLSEFFSPPAREQVVYGREDFFEKIDPQLKNKIEWIVPSAQKNLMEPVRITISPGGATYQDLPHEGEEFGYVLEGSLTVHLGKLSFDAGRGESFYYEPDVRHWISSSSGAEFIWVSCPPSF